MKTTNIKLAALSAVFVLLGAGCLGQENVSSVPDGGVYRTANNGIDWQQMVAFPSAKTVGSIGTLDMNLLEQDKQDPYAFYLGSKAEGLFFSIDGGVSWQRPRPEVLKTGEIKDIEIDPKDVCTVYIAKGSKVMKSDTCLRDVDDAVYVETRKNVMVNKIVVDWFNNQTVLIGLSNGDVLRSQDGGVTWSNILNTTKDITGILLNETDSRKILVSTKDDGFYRSEDSGVTWTQISKELKEFKSGTNVYVLEQSQKGNIVIAATKYGLLRSFDFGTTWSGIKLLTSPGQVEISALAINPTNADIIAYTAGKTLYQTTDGGETWTTVDLPSTRMASDLLLDSTGSNVLYLTVVQPKE